MEKNTKASNGEIILYKPAGKTADIEVRMNGETVWLTQKQMANLFGIDSDTVGLHLKNIYNSRELAKKPTTEDYSVVQLEGKRHVKRKLKHYNLKRTMF